MCNETRTKTTPVVGEVTVRRAILSRATTGGFKPSLRICDIESSLVLCFFARFLVAFQRRKHYRRIAGKKSIFR